MKTKEGGVVDIQKEREAFETWLFSTEKFKFRNKNFLFMLDEYGSYEDKPVLEHWETWQAAKAQAVPEGFVLMPKDPTYEMLEAGSEARSRTEGHIASIWEALIEARGPANEN